MATFITQSCITNVQVVYIWCWSWCLSEVPLVLLTKCSCVSREVLPLLLHTLIRAACSRCCLQVPMCLCWWWLWLCAQGLVAVGHCRCLCLCLCLCLCHRQETCQQNVGHVVAVVATEEAGGHSTPWWLLPHHGNHGNLFHMGTFQKKSPRGHSPPGLTYKRSSDNLTHMLVYTYMYMYMWLCMLLGWRRPPVRAKLDWGGLLRNGICNAISRARTYTGNHTHGASGWKEISHRVCMRPDGVSSK